MTTIAATVAAFAASIEEAFRTDGSSYYKLKDGSPDWMLEAIREAHGDLMPNDQSYMMVQTILTNLADRFEHDPDCDIRDGDLSLEVCDNMVPVYTADLIRWLWSAPLARMAICDEAAEDLGIDPKDSMEQRLRHGYFKESETAFAAIVRAIDDEVTGRRGLFIRTLDLPAILDMP